MEMTGRLYGHIRRKNQSFYESVHAIEKKLSLLQVAPFPRDLVVISGVATGCHGWTMSMGSGAKGAPEREREKKTEREKKKRTRHDCALCKGTI